jgi:uncharacterized protein YgbK (DUF1537 family)
MPSLRLLADDLTGALDTTVEFVGRCGPIDIYGSDTLPADLPDCFAVDSATREKSDADAARTLAALAPLLKGADIPFKKVDSLFRGPWAVELAAVFGLGAWRHCIMAPAFPHHGRHTREGRQVLFAGKDRWRDLSGDIAVRLASEGLQTGRAPHLHPSTSGPELADGVSIFDADTDEDLDDIVHYALQKARGPILWCGTGGLTQALARLRRMDSGPVAASNPVDNGPRQVPAPLSRRLEGPVLGLFGSDQAMTRAQLEGCGPYWQLVHGSGDAADVGERLSRDGVAMISLDLPAGLDRPDAAARIAAAFGGIAKALTQPATLIVAGGETLRGVCTSLSVQALRVDSLAAPGLPRSVIVGGPWDGVRVISKSGAFGSPGLWRDLLSENGLLAGGDEP